MDSTISPSASEPLEFATWPEVSGGRSRRFRQLYDAHFRLVWAVVRSAGIPAAHCEDVVQEVWLQVYRLVERLRPDASPRAWLVSIARRRVAQYYRTQRRRKRRETAYGEASDDELPSHGGRVEARSTLDRVLSGMNEDQRLTFVLIHGYGLTGEEVAQAVGDNVNTVHSRLRLARRHLRRAAAAAETEERRVGRAVLHRVQPPPRARVRMQALLLAKLGLPGLAAVAPGGAAGLAALGSSLLATAAAVGLLLGPAAPRDDEPSGLAGLALAASASSPASPADPGPPPEASVAPPLPRPEPAVTPPRGQRDRATAEPAEPAPTLAGETRLLQRAKRVLDGGDPTRALALLDEHARTFPQAVLDDVRQGVRVRALCALGHVSEARDQARSMASIHGGSVVALGVQDVCAAERPTGGDDADQ